jgi:hypothetical protein
VRSSVKTECGPMHSKKMRNPEDAVLSAPTDSGVQIEPAAGTSWTQMMKMSSEILEIGLARKGVR